MACEEGCCLCDDGVSISVDAQAKTLTISYQGGQSGTGESSSDPVPPPDTNTLTFSSNGLVSLTAHRSGFFVPKNSFRPAGFGFRGWHDAAHGL